MVLLRDASSDHFSPSDTNPLAYCMILSSFYRKSPNRGIAAKVQMRSLEPPLDGSDLAPTDYLFFSMLRRYLSRTNSDARELAQCAERDFLKARQTSCSCVQINAWIGSMIL